MFELKEVSTSKKIDLFQLSLEEATVDGFVNPTILKIFFNVNLVLMYTTLDIPLEEKLDKFNLYDKFNKEGVFEKFEEKMQEEYPGDLELLWEDLDIWKDALENYNNSLNGIIAKLQIVLSNSLDNLSQIFEGVDMSKLDQIIPLAKELGYKASEESVE